MRKQQISPELGFYRRKMMSVVYHVPSKRVLEVRVVQDCQQSKGELVELVEQNLTLLISSRRRILKLPPPSPILSLSVHYHMGLLPFRLSSTAYTIPITSTTSSQIPIHQSKQSPAASQTTSSDSIMDSDPSPPAISNKIPCLFTVEQLQQAPPSQAIERQPTNVYIVLPTAIWNSLEHIHQFISTYTAPLPTSPSPFSHLPLTQPPVEDNNKDYRTHDTIAVTRHDLPQSPIWNAHILEIRAHKPSGQVFIRVFYFYQSRQIPPSLRHNYHGRRELLASNSMAVVNATAVVNRTRVSHWHEEREPAPATASFWRQTYDVQTQTLSVCA